MLLNEPNFYYNFLRQKYAYSYLAEDELQIIIGIDCKYISSNENNYKDLENYFNKNSNNALSPFAGLFGVLSYDAITYFENIEEIKNSKYYFPKFFFADAKAYLHYDKISKLFTFYGDKKKYYNQLISLEKDLNDFKKSCFYRYETNLEEEEKHFHIIFEKAKSYLKSGDVFQVVLSEQLQIKSNMDSFSFYEKLKLANPSPYMFYFPTPYGDIVGSSPELVMKIKNNEIFVAPIAGTRGRGKNSNEDENLKNDLLSDEKELSEHKMLIDLARNDIGKFAKKSSVHVKNLMNVVFYEHVMHIITEVYGTKRKDISIFDIISIIFPAGTLSGTPKIRAMEIINELEDYKRNIYGGAVGFLHYNCDVQLAILIRSAIFTPFKDNINNVFIQAGAGIVYDSIAKKEYEEIFNKRASVLNIFIKNCKEIHDIND